MVLWVVSVGDDIRIGYGVVDRELLVVINLEETAPRLGLQVEDRLTGPYAYVGRFG